MINLIPETRVCFIATPCILDVCMNTLYSVCRFYMFGCVTVDSAGDFTYVEAPQATWFNGTATEDWTGLISQHCGSILSRSQHLDHVTINYQLCLIVFVGLST